MSRPHSQTRLGQALAMAGRCDTGRKRSHNEDFVTLAPEHGLIIVADGMGGHNAGEVASRMAAESIHDAISNTQRDSELQPSGSTASMSPQGLLLQRAISQSNDIVAHAAQNHDQYNGMGTTLVVALFHDNAITIGSVGDSRLYRFRDKRLEPITRDHTLVQELIDRGFYTPEEAHASLNRNVVTRALGVDEEVQVDIIEDAVLVGDRYLLCSDGLNDMVDDQTIERILGDTERTREDIITDLIKAANDAGGKDNVTVALVDILKPYPAHRSWFQRFVDWFQLAFVCGFLPTFAT